MSSPKSPNARSRRAWDEAGIDGDKMADKWPEMVLDETVLDYTVDEEDNVTVQNPGVGVGGDYEFHPHDPQKEETYTLPKTDRNNFAVGGTQPFNPNVFPIDSASRAAVSGPEVENQLWEFTVRDIYPRMGWFDKDEPVQLEARLLTIVGWLVSDDGVHVHVSSIYDQHEGTYGDGHVIPKTNIIARRKL